MQVLYGYSSFHDSLCVLEESDARGRAAEIQTIKSCNSLGELRAAAPKIRHVWLPEDLDELEDDADEVPWLWEESATVEVGDWPEMPTVLSMEFFESLGLSQET